MFSRIARRVAATLLGGGLVAALLLVAPAANAAPGSPGDCPSYAVTAHTNTQLTLSPRQPDSGQTFTATASVKTGGAPVTGGNVTFTFAGQTKTVAVVNGTASAQFTVPTSGGRFKITADYSGQCLANSAAVGSSGSSKAIVAGVEASRGNGNGSGNGGATVEGTEGALANTGVNGQTELFGLLGVGMVLVGGLALAVHRRRIND
jgi:hypothetical protein